MGQSPPTIYRKDAVPTVNSETKGAAILAIIGGGLAVVGCFLPWLSATTGLGGLSRNALQMGQNDSFSPDGGLILLMGIVIIIFGSVRLTSPSALAKGSCILCALIGLGDTIWMAHSVQGIVNSATAASNGSLLASIGYGLWVAGIGFVIAFVAGLILRSTRPT